MIDGYKGAIEDYNKAIELNPNYTEAYKWRGKSKEGLGNYKGAIEDYNKAIELNPNYVEAYQMRSAMKYALDDVKGAMNDLEKVIRLEPSLKDKLQHEIDKMREKLGEGDKKSER